MKIGCWNVNSIRARLDNVNQWLKDNPVDVLFLQETKAEEKDFPFDFFSDYNVVYKGQKSYNGVAVLSKKPLEFPCFAMDRKSEEARFVSCYISNLCLVNVYVPNGKVLASESYNDKIFFLKSLYEFLKQKILLKELVVVGGDFNIEPDQVGNFLSVTKEEVALWWDIINLGYIDVLRNSGFTWWDYRGSSWSKNEGMRIDHLLFSPEVADLVLNYKVCKDCRSWPRPSDHVPIVVELSL